MRHHVTRCSGEDSPDIDDLIYGDMGTVPSERLTGWSCRLWLP
ncbi:hypothetical protein AAFA46_06165 [Oscillospiraceae bacterium WX1]